MSSRYVELSGTRRCFVAFASVRGAHVIRGDKRFLRWAVAVDRER